MVCYVLFGAWTDTSKCTSYVHYGTCCTNSNEFHPIILDTIISVRQAVTVICLSACIAGYYKSGGNCVACGIGKYKSGIGNSGSCSSCSTGLTTSSTGSTSSSQCGLCFLCSCWRLLTIVRFHRKLTVKGFLGSLKTPRALWTSVPQIRN